MSTDKNKFTWERLEEAHEENPGPFAVCGERFLARAGVSRDAIVRLSFRDLSQIGLEWLCSMSPETSGDLLRKLASEDRRDLDVARALVN